MISASFVKRKMAASASAMNSSSARLLIKLSTTTRYDRRPEAYSMVPLKLAAAVMFLVSSILAKRLLRDDATLSTTKCGMVRAAALLSMQSALNGS